MLPEQTQSTNTTNGIVHTKKKNQIHSSDSSITSNSDDTTDQLSSEQPNRWVSFQDNLAENYLKRGRRLHGLQLPLHPLQIGGWVAIIGFGIATYLVIIPALHPNLQQPLFGIVTGLYLIHSVAHIAALLVDPADKELRKHRSDRIVPEFDRSKHAHVIENGRCHLCNIKTTNQRTKHCSVCNKCVGQFDHHCKWLNHCVGGRNYVAFLMCVVSAVLASMVILAAVITELILYYLKSDWLIIWSSSPTISSTQSSSNNDEFLNNSFETIASAVFNETFAFNDTTITPETVANVTETILEASLSGISIRETIFLSFISVVGILAAVSLGLLLHLCFFHVYISFLGLTTYEYIRNQRQNATQQMSNSHSAQTIQGATLNALKKSSSATELYFCSSIDPKNLIENHESKVKYRPKTLHCCDLGMQYNKTSQKAFYMCSIVQERLSNEPNTGRVTPTSNNRIRRFHCCSEYKQVIRSENDASNRDSSSDDNYARNDGSTTDSSMENYIQYVEQCTFCSFKLKASKKSDKRLQEQPQQNRHETDPERGQCCAKTLNKHHRWKRKWNCCANTPDSPDVPNDALRTVSAFVSEQPHHHHHHHHRHNHQQNSHEQQSYSHHQNGAKAINYTVKLTPGGSTNKATAQTMKGISFRPSLSTNLKTTAGRTRLVRPWSLTRFRHILRMIGRCSRPSHDIADSSAIPPHLANVKQNQVRPMNMSDQGQQPPHSLIMRQTILPTTIIRNGDGNINNTEIRGTEVIYSNLSVPALPPPTRRKIRSPTDLEELADSLTFANHQTQRNPVNTPSNNRRRRKNILRNRSPTLSPIHESGYSNPTSPIPCRHHLNNGHANNTKTTTSDSIIATNNTSSA